jgi:lantibiotic modifying enzyme
MSHGAAGFALALASLATAAGRNELAKVACECVAFENSSYDDAHKNWPDIRTDHVRTWQHKWCHGAPGIGLARIGTARRGGLDAELLARDVRNALACIESGEEERVDTLCCGTLASIEFLSEAAAALGRNDLRELASRRLTAVLELAASTGDYRWGVGSKRFHLGLFRGLAGVGYACLRQVDDSLPNVLIWD